MTVGNDKAILFDLIHTISVAATEDLPTLTKLVYSFENAETRFLALVSLAKRFRNARFTYLSQAADELDLVNDTIVRAKLMVALFDALPKHESEVIQKKLTMLLDRIDNKSAIQLQTRFVKRADVYEANPLNIDVDVTRKPAAKRRQEIPETDRINRKAVLQIIRTKRSPRRKRRRIRSIPARPVDTASYNTDVDFRRHPIRLDELVQGANLNPKDLFPPQESIGQQAMPRGPEVGKISWFNEEKGFGFIGQDSGTDVFVDLGRTNDPRFVTPKATEIKHLLEDHHQNFTMKNSDEPVDPPADRDLRIVNTGFTADDGLPQRSIMYGPRDSNFYFVEIGIPVSDAIDRAVALPSEIPDGAILDIVLFDNAKGLDISDATVGSLKIGNTGQAKVTSVASTPQQVSDAKDFRLFFRVTAPKKRGVYDFRCNLYHRNTLLQSRRVTVPVGLDRQPSVEVDYIISRSLLAAHIASLGSPTLSIMLNENENGTHSFRFYSKDTIRTSANFDGLALNSIIEKARTGLRRAAWNTDEDWNESAIYRFDKKIKKEEFKIVLHDLARRGHSLWDSVINKLAGGPDNAAVLREVMQKQGSVELAMKEAANSVLPISLFFDHRLDSALTSDKVVLCDDFLESLENGECLSNSKCFAQGCAGADKTDHICPSGFWGFRHSIGLPISIGSNQDSPPESPLVLERSNPLFMVALSTDPAFQQIGQHINGIELSSMEELDYSYIARAREETLQLLRDSATPIVYFYCHGGIDDVVGPFLNVGPKDEPFICRTHLRDLGYCLQKRSLVFINGCHTTGVSPDQAIELVSQLVQTNGAQGVIGTEITIFESLARHFSESFFHQFVVKNNPVGKALRNARLDLLKEEMNPLGLVYIPFVSTNLVLAG